ncbi:MAG: hypothetical protein CL793_07765 [Chloroflexi bacterium]|nr:hypothetical protein [Chloroflexota bacterium]|tara:strand:+ start:16962 stop:17972 length:1011 start_codon:yes stop_codon:yes gene_type:complete
MAQVSGGSVRVENGSNTIRHIWDVQLENGASAFAEGDVITWDGGSGSTGGDGVVASFTAGTLRLYFYRTAGANPTVGETITDSTTTKTGAIASFYPNSPPNWSTDPDITSGGTKMVVFGSDATGNYTLAASTQHTSDTFELTTNYVGTTGTIVSYGIHTDFTPNLGLPTVNYGDVNAVALVTRGLVELDRRGKFRGAMVTMTAQQTIAAATETTIVPGTTAYDTDTWVATANAGFFTVPSGVAKVRVSFSVRAVADVVSTWRCHVLKNATTSYAGFTETNYAAVDDATPITGNSPAIAVAAGDTLKLQTLVSAETIVALDSATWFAIEAVELTAAS